MFDIGWGEFLVLVLAALFILGPERLPGAARWLGRTVRHLREYATGAHDQLKSELGPDFEELRKPLDDLRQLRDFDPRHTIRRHLLDATGGYDPLDELRRDSLKPNGYPRPNRSDQQRPLTAGERPPFDPDAT